MNKISTLLIPGAICLIIAWLIYDYSIVKNNLGIMQAVLFGLLFIAFIIFSNINFRDSSRNLISNKKAKTAKLHVVTGLFLVPLVMLSGVTIIHSEEVESSKSTHPSKARIETSTDGFSKQLDTVEDSLRNHIDSSAVKKFNDLIIMWIPFLISILCMGVGIAIVYISLLNRKWPSLKDGFPVFAAVFLILIGILGLVEAKRSLQDWVTALGAAALLAIIIIRYNPFNRSDQESIKVNKKGDESSAEQELAFERGIMDRIQQRITVFTTTLALFGGLIGLFGYISLLDIEDTENKVDEMGRQAQEAKQEMNNKVKEMDNKAEEMEQKMDNKAEEMEQEMDNKAEEMEQKMDNKAEEMEQEMDNKAEEMEQKMDNKAEKIDTEYHQTMERLWKLNNEVDTLIDKKVKYFSSELDNIIKEKIDKEKQAITDTVTKKLQTFGDNLGEPIAHIKENKREIQNLKEIIGDLNAKLDEYLKAAEFKDKITAYAKTDTVNQLKEIINNLKVKLDEYQKEKPE